MPTPLGSKVAELFIDVARDANAESRYPQALAAAERAILTAERLDDPVLLVRALNQQECALRLLGDYPAALVRSGRILAMAEDPAARDELSHSAAATAIADAYVAWAAAARMDQRAAPPDLLGVLDDADRWLTATGHFDWRAGVLLQRAEIHSDLGDTAMAVDLAQEALAAYSPDGPGFSLACYHNCLGRVLSAAGRYSKAVRHFQASLDVAASSPFDRVVAHAGLADAALRPGRVERAPRHAEAAVTLGESCGDNAAGLSLAALVRVRRATRDWDGAWDAATRRLAVARRSGGHAQRYEATRTVVEVALDRGDLPAAGRFLADLSHHADVLDKAQGQTKLAAETAQLERRIADRAGRPPSVLAQYDEAVTDLSRAIDLEPADASLIAQRGETYRLMERYDEAATDLSRAIDLEPGYGWAIGSRGQAYQALGRYDEAVTDLSRAIDLEPGYAWAIWQRGETYRLMGRYDDAVTDLSRAIDLEPAHAWAIGSRGPAHQALGRYDDAVPDLSRAIDLEPADAWLIAQRGETYRLMGRYDDAVTDLSRAIDLEPADAWAIAQRGETYRLMGRYDDAVTDLSRAIDLEPADAWLIARRGETYRLMEGDDEAVTDPAPGPASTSAPALPGAPQSRADGRRD